MLLLSSKIWSQEPVHYFIGKDFFSSHELYSIIQDNDLNMWLTSDKGLYHYNGLSFSKISLSKEIKNTSLFGLRKDSKGRIYCFNLNGQIFRVENKQLKLYYTLPKKFNNQIGSIEIDNKGNLFIRTLLNLLVLSPEKEMINFYDLNCDLLNKSKDTLYYSYFDKATDSTNFIARINNTDSLMYKIRLNKKESLTYFFQKNKQIFAFKRNGNIIYQFVKDRFLEIYNFKRWKNEMLYLGLLGDNFWAQDMNNGVYLLPTKGFDKDLILQKWFKNYLISGFYEDSEQNTWLLTFNNGIIIIPNLNNQIIKAPANKKIKSITKTNNTIYLGVKNHWIYTLQNKQLKPYQKLEKSDRAENIRIFKSQNIVVTGDFIYSGKKSIGNGYTRDAVILNNNLYTGMPYTLYCFNLQLEPIPHNMPVHERIYDIEVDERNNSVWISTTSGLICFKNGVKKNMIYENKDILEAKILVVNDEVWVAYQHGILIFKDDTITQKLTIKDGLLTKKIDAIRYEFPYVYIANEKGMQRYHTENKTFENFTKGDGLTQTVLDFEVLNDTVYSITSDGLLRFTFNDKQNHTTNYFTRITEAIANADKVFVDNALLEADENTIEFSFLTPTYRYQKNISYKYQLVGYEKELIKPREGVHYVRYPNLPSGNYQFIVRSFIDNKENKPAILHFRIKNYWYNTWIFKISSIILIIAGLYYVYRTRLNVINRKRNEEAMQKRLAESSLTSLKAQMNPHFLFNAMNSISLLIVENQNKEAFKYLTRLSNLVRENLMMSDVTFVPFADELKLIKKYLDLEKLRFEETFTFAIENNITNQQIYIPSMIIQPFIENSMKHGLLHKKINRQLRIVFTEKNDLIECVIIDNGIGREASEKIQQKRKYKSFSTNAIKKRFEILREYYKLDVGFEYEDMQPTGTKVTIKIPISND